MGYPNRYINANMVPKVTAQKINCPMFSCRSFIYPLNPYILWLWFIDDGDLINAPPTSCVLTSIYGPLLYAVGLFFYIVL